ncbi:unnamed protein product, partial [Rangifer tarandus platyrhynchus]
YYLLEYLLMAFLFVFFFWDSYDSNVGVHIRRETPDLLCELLPPKKRHHELPQLHPRFPARAEEDGPPHAARAAPEVLEESERRGP